MAGRVVGMATVIRLGMRRPSLVEHVTNEVTSHGGSAQRWVQGVERTTNSNQSAPSGRGAPIVEEVEPVTSELEGAILA